MKKGTVRAVLSVAIMVLTAALFVRYFQTHPAYINQLKHIGGWWIFGILLADLAGVTALAFLIQTQVRMTGKNLGVVENWLLTVYSSIANFFGPLQSGPGVRAAYLKTKHGVSLWSYFVVTLFSYAVYAIISAFILLVGARPWWQTTFATLAAIGLSAVIIWISTRRKKGSFASLDFSPRFVFAIIGFTALQITFIGIRYYLALRAAGTDVSLGQIVSYTGAANFALFVSITPDGIGIREAFLLFAQNIHHVPTDAIVTASLIDRAVYVVFLGILFIVALSLHAKARFAPATKQQAASDTPKADTDSPELGNPKSR